MAGTRRQAREWALQALYLSDASGMIPERAVAVLQAELRALGEVAGPFAESLYRGTLADRKDLDEKIQSIADNWEISRMSVVDRNLLRLATHELISDYETPVAVVIDEALEIGKKYSSADSSRFLNGVLDKAKKFRQNGGKKAG